VDDESRLFIVYQSSATASGRGWYLVHGKDGIFSDTLRVDNLTPTTRNTSCVVARGNGEIAVTYSPGGSRGGSVVCDIFMKRGKLQTTGVDGESLAPASYALLQNYPNPFNPSTAIGFRIQETGFTTLKVYDILGCEIATLVNEELQPGHHEVRWNAANIAGGVYFYELRTGMSSQTKKLVLLR
jgi:hypothetical protein